MLVLLTVVVLLLVVNMKLLFAPQFPVKPSFVILLMDVNMSHTIVMTMMLALLIFAIVKLTPVLIHLLIVTITISVQLTSALKDYVILLKRAAMIMMTVQTNIAIVKLENVLLKPLNVTITIYVLPIPALKVNVFSMNHLANVMITIFAQ
jgi:hypothetical protein